MIWCRFCLVWHLYFIVTRDLCRESFVSCRAVESIPTSCGTAAGQRRSLTSALITQHISLFLFLVYFLALSTSSKEHTVIPMFRHAENAFYDRERATLNILITLQLIATTQKRERWKRDRARERERERKRERKREREKERKRENDIYYISYKFWITDNLNFLIEYKILNYKISESNKQKVA